VREALKRLAEDRLVDLIPRSGCFIANPAKEDIICLFDIRKRLECLALEYAFDRFNLEKIKKMREQFENCLEFEQAKMVSSEIKLDEQLHEFICESSGSDDLYSLISKLLARIQLFRIKEASNIERARQAIDHHIKILDAILSGDRVRAEQLLLHHIEESQRYFTLSFDKEE
jgi:DNA-binding GntR family transcriptional regulator